MTVTLDGMNFRELGQTDLQVFVQVLEVIEQLAHRREWPSLGSEPIFQVTSEEVAEVFGHAEIEVDPEALAVAGSILLDFSGLTRGGGRPGSQREWMAVIDLMALARYRGVTSVDQLLAKKRAENEDRERLAAEAHHSVVRIPRGSGLGGMTRTEEAATATVEGLVAALQPNVDQDFIFVIMPFSEPWSQKVYGWMTDAVIALKQQRPGLNIEKSGARHTERPWVDKLQRSIRRAGLIVCDLSNDATGATNGNCLYELGLAHGYDRKTIVISQSPAEDVPSDVRSWENILRYSVENHDGFVASMKEWISEAMGLSKG
jgi:hypothetical protein